jgi:hypothetical protein
VHNPDNLYFIAINPEDDEMRFRNNPKVSIGQVFTPRCLATDPRRCNHARAQGTKCLGRCGWAHFAAIPIDD